MIFQFSASVQESKENRTLLRLPEQVFQKRQNDAKLYKSRNSANVLANTENHLQNKTLSKSRLTREMIVFASFCQAGQISILQKIIAIKKRY